MVGLLIVLVAGIGLIAAAVLLAFALSVARIWEVFDGR